MASGFAYIVPMKGPMIARLRPLFAFISAAVLAAGAHGAENVRHGNGPTGDHDIIVQLRADAEQGNVKAQYVLGCCYNGDHGFAREPAQAAKWWGVAAANGMAEAQFCVGLSCFMGEGVPKDASLAVKWWRMAAAQDHPDAQYFLGLSYHTGLGAPKDNTQAIYWLRKSASHGSKAASDQLKEITSAPG